MHADRTKLNGSARRLSLVCYQLITSAVSAGGKEEGHGLRHVRADLGAERCEVLSEQRLQHYRQDDQAGELVRRGGEFVRGERWERQVRIGSGKLG